MVLYCNTGALVLYWYCIAWKKLVLFILGWSTSGTLKECVHIFLLTSTIEACDPHRLLATCRLFPWCGGKSWKIHFVLYWDVQYISLENYQYLPSFWLKFKLSELKFLAPPPLKSLTSSDFFQRSVNLYLPSIFQYGMSQVNSVIRFCLQCLFIMYFLDKIRYHHSWPAPVQSVQSATGMLGGS